MLADLDEIEHKVNAQLEEWLLRDEAIIIECQGESLADSRYWKCDLGEGDIAVIPCGAMHANRFDEFESVQASLIELGPKNIEMHTKVKENTGSWIFL